MKKFFYRLLFWIILIFLFVGFFLGNLYIKSSNLNLQNKYIKDFEISLDLVNTSLNEFLLNFESAIYMLSSNENLIKVTTNTNYYNSTINLFKSFQESYSSTAYAYFAPINKLDNGKKLITWPDTSNELSTKDWFPISRPWYNLAIKNKNLIIWTDPYTDATTKEQTLTVSKTVQDKNDNIIGVLAIDIFLKDLKNKIKEFKTPNKFDIFLIDKEGNFIEIVSNNLNSNKLNTNYKLKENLNLKGKNNYYDYINDEKYYISYKINPSTNWKLISMINYNDILEETKQFKKDMFIIISLVISFGILSIIYIFISMNNSIKTLSLSLKENIKKDKTNHKFIDHNFNLLKEFDLKSNPDIILYFKCENLINDINCFFNNNISKSKNEIHNVLINEYDIKINLLIKDLTQLNNNIAKNYIDSLVKLKNNLSDFF
ncbi:MAG: cache domain-containing protein [Peptostreptococcaceae bacterium]|nr:cache domain-containing protein [Peptostreptococcaceae bacterium]